MGDKAVAKESKRWQDIRRTLSPEREASIKVRVAAELAKLPLAEVRKAQQMTQVRLAEILHVNQGAVSKLEQRSDMYLSTLRSYIEAMGGHLDIRAVFPNGEVVLERLSDTAAGSNAPAKTAKRPQTLVAVASGNA
jgi:DNA-binding XRE family transcriptional regulator